MTNYNEIIIIAVLIKNYFVFSFEEASDFF